MTIFFMMMDGDEKQALYKKALWYLNVDPTSRVLWKDL